MDPVLIEHIIAETIDAATNQFPWDAGYRADLYRAVANGLIELADFLDLEDPRRGPCAGT